MHDAFSSYKANHRAHSRKNAMYTQLYGSLKTLYQYMARGTNVAHPTWAEETKAIWDAQSAGQRGKEPPRMPKSGMQGDRKVPCDNVNSRWNALRHAVETCRLPTMENFSKFVAGKLGWLEAFPVQPSDSESAKKMTLREVLNPKEDKRRPGDSRSVDEHLLIIKKEKKKMARQRQCDNLLSRARPGMPGVTAAPTYNENPRFPDRSRAKSDHLPDPSKTARAAQVLDDIEHGRPGNSNLHHGLRKAVKRARERAASGMSTESTAAAASGVSAEASARPPRLSPESAVNYRDRVARGSASTSDSQCHGWEGSRWSRSSRSRASWDSWDDRRGWNHSWDDRRGWNH